MVSQSNIAWRRTARSSFTRSARITKMTAAIPACNLEKPVRAASGTAKTWFGPSPPCLTKLNHFAKKSAQVNDVFDFDPPRNNGENWSMKIFFALVVGIAVGAAAVGFYNTRQGKSAVHTT